MVRSLLLAILLLAPLAPAAAQYVGPPPIALRYRLYGADAKPIALKECRVFQGFDLPASVAEINTSDVVDNIISTTYYRYYGMPGVTIIRARDTMRISGYCDLDSLPFSPGDFVVPGSFEWLLNGIKGGHVTITPGWPDFRVKSILDTPRVRMIEARQIVTVNNVTEELLTLMYVTPVPGASAVLTAIKPRSSGWLLVPKGSPTAEWGRKVEYPFDDKSILDMSALSLNEIWVKARQANGDTIFRATVDGGGRWSLEKKAPAWGAVRREPRNDTMNQTFLSVRRGFMATHGGASDSCSLYRTSDAGRTWEMVFATRGAGKGAVHFFDDRNGSFVTSRFVLRTTDGGERWEYLPFESRPFLDINDRYAYRATLTDFFYVDPTTLCLYGPVMLRWVYLDR